MTDHFQSVSMMIEDLRSDDPESRLSSMRGLHCIAQTLGPDRVRSELLPYIMDYLDDDDEVLRTLASALGTMLAEVGGPSQIEALFGPLETLCSLDEISVREESIQSLCLLSKNIYSSGENLVTQQNLFMSLVTRLSKNPEPRARASACGLIGSPYESASPTQKKEFKAKFVTLCSDEEVLVRRAACAALGKSVAAAFGSTCNDLLQTFVTLCKDGSDAVRLQAVQAAVSVVPNLKESNVTQVFNALKTLSSDSSWRVRYMFSDCFPKLCQVLPKKEVKNCTAIFKSAVQDVEAEIRASMIFALDSLLKFLGDDASKKDVLVSACRLANDPNPHVRTSLATSILKATPHATKEMAMNSITPCCNELLQDMDADVRLALLSGFSEITGGSSSGGEVASIIAPKLLAPIINAAENKDNKWRVRETVVRQAPHIIPFLSQENATQLASICLEGLIDRVATIRAAAGEGCVRLIERNGVEWGRSALLPRLKNMADTPSFLPRLTYLQVMQKLSPVVDASFMKEVLPTIQKLATDPVPNVRIHVVKALIAAKTARHMSPAECDSLLVKFAVDKDPDVRDVAKSHK